MIISIRIKCSPNMRGILRSRLCQEAPSRMSLISLKLKIEARMNKITSGSTIKSFTKMKYKCLQCRNKFRLRPNIDIISLKVGQLHSGRELTVSW